MASFETSSPRADVAVIAFGTQAIGGPDAVELAGLVRDVIGGGARAVVLDLGNVSIMNSSGLGMLVSTLTTAKKFEATLRLASVPEKVMDLLSMTQLTSVFDIHPTVDAAVASV